MTPRLLEPVLQRDAEEISDVLVVAEDCRVEGEPLVRRYKDVWVLGVQAVRLVERAGAAAGPSPVPLLPYRRPPSSLDIVSRWLRDHESVTTGDVAELTGLTKQGALRQLERLEIDDVLARGVDRGRNAHFVGGPALRHAPVPGPLLSSS